MEVKRVHNIACVAVQKKRKKIQKHILYISVHNFIFIYCDVQL